MDSISPEQMAVYKATARRRWQAEQEQQAQRQEQAWRLAHEAARLLRDDYQVTEVRLFGSLVQPGRFGWRSDVDLAAWGLTAKTWLRAAAAVRALSDEIEINLVDVAVCSAAVRASIEREGIPLQICKLKRSR
jgi:uncharacterized protein